jgi:hypothetical protein
MLNPTMMDTAGPEVFETTTVVDSGSIPANRVEAVIHSQFRARTTSELSVTTSVILEASLFLETWNLTVVISFSE